MAIRLSKNGKRLGRPPKNKNSGVVFVSPVEIKKEETFVEPPADVDSVIECEFMPISQFSHAPTGEKKEGRYMTSIYSIDGFGKNRWVVGAYIKADLEKYKILRWHDSEIVKRCVNYLNSIAINKKGKKKYGNLQLHKFNKINKFGQEIIVVELITDERKNENFWGEGERM
jgi:hypothetical protein